MFTIKNINSLDLIEELKREHREEFIDAIITDPPYNISRENNFETIGRKGIHFGPWDCSFDQETWIRQATPLIKRWKYNNFQRLKKLWKNFRNIRGMWISNKRPYSMNQI